MLKFAIIYDLKCLISNQKIETCRQSRKYNLYTRNKQVTETIVINTRCWI